MKRLPQTIGIVAGLALIGLGAVWYFGGDAAVATAFRTAKVGKGDLLISIDATGTVEPEEVIDVGTQVGGKITSFGTDAAGKPIDYGSNVEAGMVLARIDDALYQAQVDQAQAKVRSAKASVQSAQANLLQLRAKYLQASRDWARARKLGASEALSQASYDSYQSANDTAQANVAVGEAAILQAKASLSEAEATLSEAIRNLGYCTITSPVKGVIIDRRVNIGQTVVSTMSASSLFLLAKDLTRMQVWVAVNEADIGKIEPGQPVSFTVDAFPGETFVGKVGKVRLNASMTQNVVSYTVEIVTDNSNGRLLPYLTANVQFELARRAGVLLAPTAALRWKPKAEQVAPEFREALAATGGGQGKRGVVWVADGGQVRPVRVTVGLSDGAQTEISGPEVAEGMTLVVGYQPTGAATATQTASTQSDASANPFTPKLPKRPPGGGGPPH